MHTEKNKTFYFKALEMFVFRIITGVHTAALCFTLLSSRYQMKGNESTGTRLVLSKCL